MRNLLLLSSLLLAGCATEGGLNRLRPDAGAYRAAGADPAWSLSVDRRVLIFESAGNRLSEVVTAADSRNGARTYRSASAAVTSSVGRCSLPGDPAVYPETVVATVNGGTYRGCGGAPLAAGALAGSSWRVLSVKGQPLAPAANATMRFDQSRLSGRFGCNSLSAPYVLSGAVMSVGAAAMTRMACPDMTAEQDAAAILTGLVTVRWEAADRLTLSAPAGAIVLVR